MLSLIKLLAFRPPQKATFDKPKKKKKKVGHATKCCSAYSNLVRVVYHNRFWRWSFFIENLREGTNFIDCSRYQYAGHNVYHSSLSDISWFYGSDRGWLGSKILSESLWKVSNSFISFHELEKRVQVNEAHVIWHHVRRLNDNPNNQTCAQIQH